MRKLVPIILIAALAAGAVYLAYVRANREPEISGPVLKAQFLDEQFGNAVVLTMPDGKMVVIDPAPGRAAEALLEMLQSNRMHEVSVIISNPTLNRADALAAIQSVMMVSRVIRPELGTAAGQWARWLRREKWQPMPETIVVRGDSVRLAPKVRLEVLSPARNPAPRGGDDNSLVFRVRFGDKSILFPSDIRTKSEAELIGSGIDLESSVLVAGRHGRNGSTSLELLSMVRPEICIVSTQHGSNRPAPSVLNRLSAVNTGAALYRTDKDGIIEIDTDGRSIQVSTGGGGP
jgi:competence protein ComEC